MGAAGQCAAAGAPGETKIATAIHALASVSPAVYRPPVSVERRGRPGFRSADSS